jgi:hypothetical protein
MPKHRKTPRKVLARPAKPYPNCFRRQVCDKAPGWRHRQRRQQDKELEELEAQPETQTETPLEAQMIAWRPPEPYPHDEQMTKSCMRPQDTQPDPDKKVTWQVRRTLEDDQTNGRKGRRIPQNRRGTVEPKPLSRTRLRLHESASVPHRKT